MMDYNLDFKDGKLFVSFNYEKKDMGTINMELDLELIAILELAAKSTDNAMDDTLIGLVKKALGK